MPRTARSLVAGSYYYVTTKAGYGTLLFRDESDFRAWVSAAKALLDTMSGIRVPAWCLLPDCLHMIVRDEGTDLASFMRRLLGRYSRSRRDLYGSGRRLYGGERYHSTRLEAGELEPVFSHIAHLPSAGGLVLFSDMWQWSSTQEWLGSSSTGVTWLDPALSGPSKAERAALMRGMLDAPHVPPALGPRRETAGDAGAAPVEPRMLPSDPAGLLAKELRVRKGVLLAPRGLEQKKTRHRAFEECRTRWGMSFAEIARAFGVTPGAVVQALSGSSRTGRTGRTAPAKRKPGRKVDENQERLL